MQRYHTTRCIEHERPTPHERATLTLTVTALLPALLAALAAPAAAFAVAVSAVALARTA